MGCTTSKHSSKWDGWTPPLSRSMSLPTHSAGMEVENFDRITSKSRPSSMPNSNVVASDLSTVVDLSGHQKLKTVKEEEPEEKVETVDARDGFYVRLAPSASAFEARKPKLLERSASVHSVQKADAELRSSDSRICFKEDEFGREIPSFEENSFVPAVKLPCSSFRSFSVRESIHGATGLRLLLCPVDTPSRSFTSSTCGATLNRSFSSNRSLNLGFRGDHFSAFPRTLDMSRSPSARDEDAGCVEEPDSPLFDPSILATFEKAVEAVSDDNWQSSDISTSSSSENTSSSSETCSDADSPELPRESGISLEQSEFSRTSVREREEGRCKGVGSISQRRGDATYTKMNSFSKVSPFDDENTELCKEDYLDIFEMKCPPGCEGKLVLYFTSLRGIRKTFEDCCSIRLMLKGFRLHVDERDISMHSKFRQELIDVMGVAVSVPRLFMNGRYIGGAEEVKQLHEEGILRKLFEGLPTEWRNVCDVCGDVRFVPCITCSGSCKTISQDDKKSRCPDCNENGLIMCPSCDW